LIELNPEKEYIHKIKGNLVEGQTIIYGRKILLNKISNYCIVTVLHILF